MFRTSAALTAALLGSASLISPALGADMLRPSYAPGPGYAPGAPAPKKAFSVGVEIGRMTGQSHEFVYSSGRKISELIWDVEGATTLGVMLKGRTVGGLETRLRGTFAVHDDSYMEDYDWLGPELGIPTYDWTHASYHEDTTLDHAFNLDAQFSKRVIGKGRPAGLNLLGGVRHNNIKWTARGGDYTYSTHAHRDTVGTFPEGQDGISYEQSFTSPYVGVEANVDTGRFSAHAGALIGMPVFSGAEDDHWMRALNFDDDTGGHYFLGLEAEAAFDVTESFGLTAGLRHERYSEGKGPSRGTDTFSGLSSFFGDDSAGASHEQTNITLGARYNF